MKIGFLSGLFFLFLFLKLTDAIDWSWWWVTAPLWGIPALLITMFIIWVSIPSKELREYRARQKLIKQKKEFNAK